jgi:hypothetical protein
VSGGIVSGTDEHVAPVDGRHQVCTGLLGGVGKRRLSLVHGG